MPTPSNFVPRPATTVYGRGVTLKDCAAALRTVCACWLLCTPAACDGSSAPPSQDDPPLAVPDDTKSPPAAATKPLEPAQPDTAQEAAPPEPETPRLPTSPYKVLLLGDSYIATGLGALLERELDAHPHIDAYRRGKSSSGLARPDFFDWQWEGRRQVELRSPDMVVVLVGGNDGQDMSSQSGQRKRVPWDTDAWKTEYRMRMDAFLAALSAPGRKIVWLALPRTNTNKFESKLRIIRAVQREAVEAFGEDATYLETSPFLEADDGSLMSTAIVGKARAPVELRADDGIHFTMAGSEFLAAALAPRVVEALGLPPASELETTPAPEPAQAPAPEAEPTAKSG